MTVHPSVHTAYALARERFAEVSVDTDAVLKTLDAVPISLHCWQGDDVRGFENPDGELTGGIQTSGSHPGRARTATQLRDDLDFALAQIPGAARLNLHAIYLETEKPVERDAIQPEHFRNWVSWAKQRGLGLDFNPTYFSHPLSADGLTLSHPSAEVRRFWIDHGLACRRVSDYFGEALGSPCVMNIWIPDGTKDHTPDRLSPRLRLIEALDAIVTPDCGAHHKLAVEGKLFGIGAESFTVGSNDFYLAYAATRKLLLTLDAGHFHPTEDVSDKISTALCFVKELLLHVSRPVRWDSDHVVLLDDPTQAIANEIVRCDALARIHIGLDFFDASINRVAAWVIGTRNMRKALLRALLEPRARLAAAAARSDGAEVMALFEEQKSAPWPAVWDFYCATKEVPVGLGWLAKVQAYEADVLSKRESA